MASHSSTLATSLSLFTFMHWRRKWQPTPVFLPGESQGQGSWWAAIYGVAQRRTRLKWLSIAYSPVRIISDKASKENHFVECKIIQKFNCYNLLPHSYPWMTLFQNFQRIKNDLFLRKTEHSNLIPNETHTVSQGAFLLLKCSPFLLSTFMSPLIYIFFFQVLHTNRQEFVFFREPSPCFSKWN